MKSTIRQKLLLFSLIILGGVLFTGYAVYESNQKLLNAAQWVQHTEQVIYQSDKILSVGKDMETATRGYVITQDSTFLEPLYAAQKIAFVYIDQLHQLTLDNPLMQQHIDSLNFYMHRRLDYSLHTIALRSKQGLAAATALTSTKEGKGYTDQLRHITNTIQQQEKVLLKKRKLINEQSVTLFNKLSVMMFVLTIVSSVLLLITTGRYLLQTKEKENRAAELLIANKELVFQNEEKGKRALELSASLERGRFLASIAENIHDPVIATDNNFIITRWNKAAEKLLEWKSEEVIGKQSGEILKGNYPYSTREQILELLKENHFWQGEVIYKTKSGSPVNVLISTSYLKDATEKTTGILVLARDITLRKKSEEALSKLNQVLEQKVIERTEKLTASEMRFRLLIENSAEGITLTDEFSNIIYRSPGSEKITGMLPTENAINLTHPEDLETIKKKHAELLTKPGIPVGFQGRFLNALGNYIWLEGTFTNLLHTEGVNAIVTNYRDVTQRKEGEQQLIKSEKIYKTIASSIPGSVICLLDADYRYLLIEGDMLEKLGYSKEKLLGNKAAEVLPVDLFTTLEKEFKKVFTGEVVTIESSRPGYDIISRYIPLKDENNIVYAMMTVAIDVTSLKNAQRKITELNNGLEDKITKRTSELKASNEELESFSYSVSHDLRAPLRAVNGYAKMLKEKYETQLDDEANRLINKITSNAKKMAQLIDDLLTFSRIGRRELAKMDIRMNDIATTICSELKMEQGDRNIEFHISPLIPALADHIAIKQVWLNLISNAIKYTKPKEKAIIEIGSEIKENEIVYHIKDNGAGFDMRYANKLFGVFQRLHSDDEFEGTGVGLAIVQRIIAKHGGKVWAEGEVNKGATFYFSLTKS